MAFTKYLQSTWRDHSNNSSLKSRIIGWRRSLSVVRVDNPERLDRARRLGYKAKNGYILARVRLIRGGRQRPLIKKGRRSRARRRLKIISKPYQQIAEERAARKFKNCEVLNSYEIAKDGKFAWFEVILLDRSIVKNYSNMEWVSKERGRVFRGKTSAGKRGRGLRNKGRGAEKIRPSLKAKR